MLASDPKRWGEHQPAYDRPLEYLMWDRILSLNPAPFTPPTGVEMTQGKRISSWVKRQTRRTRGGKEKAGSQRLRG